jgi:hypothetical protein
VKPIVVRIRDFRWRPNFDRYELRDGTIILAIVGSAELWCIDAGIWVEGSKQWFGFFACWRLAISRRKRGILVWRI